MLSTSLMIVYVIHVCRKEVQSDSEMSFSTSLSLFKCLAITCVSYPLWKRNAFNCTDCALVSHT